MIMTVGGHGRPCRVFTSADLYGCINGGAEALS